MTTETHTPEELNSGGWLAGGLRAHALDDCGGDAVPTHICNLAADLIDALRAENERLREALANHG